MDALLKLSILIYVIVYTPGIIVAMIVNIRNAKLYRISRRRAAIYTILMIAFGIYGATLGAKTYNYFEALHNQYPKFNMAIYGTIFTVIITMTVGVLLEQAVRKKIRKKYNPRLPNVSLLDTLDMLEAGAFILVFTAKARCAIVGCCHGIPCNWGFYCDSLSTTVFPVQLCEMAITLSILIIVYHLKRASFFRRGMAIFLAGGMFAFGRFFLEYLMYYIPEDRTYLGFFTFWQCCSILVFIVCVSVIAYLFKTQPADPLPRKGEPLPDPPKQKKPQKTHSHTVSQKKYSKGWQSTKKKYKKKK